MNFLALNSATAYALLAGVALIIALLHLLKPPPPRLVVASVLLWARVVRERKRPNARRLLSLLLALGAGLSIALALTRPEVPGLGTHANRLAVVLDNSPSMASRTRDGHSRWQHATEQAQALLQRSSTPNEVLMIDTAGQLRTSGFLDRKSALRALSKVSVATSGNAPVVLPQPSPGMQMHVFSDGVAPIPFPESATMHSVFEAADNIALTAFEVRPLTQDPTRYEGMIQVLNASPRDQRVRLLITGRNNHSITQDLRVRAGDTVNAIFDLSEFEGGVVGAAVVGESDAFSLDDVAYAVIPPHAPKRVLLVTPGNPSLQDALRSLPGVHVTTVAPQNYRHPPEYDVFVFDRFAPAEPPATSAILLGPPARKWLVGQRTMLSGARITNWDRSHVVTGGIAWSNVRVARAAIQRGKRGVEALVQAGGSASGSLVATGTARARWMAVGFALDDSNFALQPDFPVFLGNALGWTTEPTRVLVRELGSVAVALRDAQVRDGRGEIVAASATDQGVVFDAARADVYTLNSPHGQLFVVTKFPAAQSLINHSDLSGAATTRIGRALPLWNDELWVLLLLLAGALLLVEWAVYTRRRTA